MPVPRLSQSEATRAAAAQAEFNEKKWVWVPDDKEGYLAGWVNKEDGEEGEIVLAAGGDIRRVPLYALSKMNPPKFDRVEDIADLTFLNEASVVHNLRLRYGSGAIYTYSGLFLVAINPYQNLPLYSDAIIQQYRNKRRDENPPHIFAVAERAWISMGEERENQSILITGESGAGKTESTKKVIQYLAAIATDAHLPTSPSVSMSTSSSFGPIVGLPTGNSFKRKQASISSSPTSHMTAKGRLGLLERQILQANPILEAFGNAQTQRNNNSSRFGKFIRITFAPDGSIAGANVDWYLLEKSRVVVRSEAERCFHVFYQLMAGGGELKKTLLLDGGIEDYNYLNKSRREVDGIDDKEEWSALMSALEIMGFTPAEQLDLFRVVAAIMHIGNIVITSTRADDAVMPDPSQAERVCYLLGVPVPEFTRAVLRPRVLAGREWVSQARTRQQALDEMAALCKTLYEKSFGALVDRINRALDRPSSKSTFIGVLDIAGFEIFEVNAYEQLLINYTNEKLQQFFNHHMFVLEQEEYAREGIEWDYVNFGHDLQPTIDLIEASGNVIGILSCLDEECIMPKATDMTFTEKLNHMWAGELHPNAENTSPAHPGRDKYEASRFEQGFIIQHYAGKVEYRTGGWLEKNKDPLNDNLTRVLASSSERYISTLFAEYGEQGALAASHNSLAAGKKRILKKGAFRTVAQRHRVQLASLMAQLQATQPHFVRCIVPNGHKKLGRIDVPLVLDQLRCNGVLEGIRIARLGYPNRLPFVDFRQRYELLTPGIIPRGYMDGRKACLRMVDALELDKTFYRVGTSKIFFKAGVLAELEERRDALLYDIFSRLQAVARMWMCRRQVRKILNRAVAIRTIQRNARVYGELRDWPWWQLYTKVRPLLATTRNDEELQRKEVELALIKERAERDKQEREILENLKMTLEAQKRKVEEELEAERMLASDKDDLLERLEEDLVRAKERMESTVADLQSKLDVEVQQRASVEDKADALEHGMRQAREQLTEMTRTHSSLLAKERAAQADLTRAQVSLEELKRSHDSEVLSLRTRQNELEDQLTNAVRVKEGLEHQLGSAKDRYRDFEDTVLQLERDKSSHAKQLESTRHQLESESARRAKLEQQVASQKSELEKVKDRAVKLDRDLSKALTELKNREWEVRQLESRQDKTIVEHVHVLEEAKKLTDRQLAEAREELEKNAVYIRSLEKLKIQDAEDRFRKELSSRSHARLEALAAQQRAIQDEADSHRKHAHELAQAKRQLEADLTNLQERLNKETAARQEETASKRKLQDHLKAADVERSKALRAETLSRRALQDTEKAHSEAQQKKDGLERRLQASERRVRELGQKLEEEGRDSSALDTLQQRLAEELEDERAQHQKELAERDFAADLTQKKYQTELAQLSEELQSQRDLLSRLREDNRKLRSDYDELRIQYDDEVYNGGAWKKEKERYETKIDDLSKAFEAASAAQAEQQTQIVNLHSQVRELRNVLNDAESDRVLLQKARRALQAELEAIKMDHSDNNKKSSDREFQILQLKKQDLERSLEEQEDRVTMAFERMRKAEAYVAECQIELGKIRVENSELEKRNAHLEKHVKELNVRIVDLETKSYTNSSSRPSTLARRRDSRIEEHTNQLAVNSGKNDHVRNQRSPEKGPRDQKSQQLELERQRQRMEEERLSYETQIENLRRSLDAFQTEESSLQLAKRRAEREAGDYKQKALSLEREVERLRASPIRTYNKFAS